MAIRLPSFRSTQGFDRRVWTLFYGRIISSLGFSVVMPFLSIYLHNELGISMTIVGMVLLISAVVGALGQIVGGELADIMGRRKIMIIAMAARSTMFLALAYVISGGADIFVITIMVSLSSLAGSFFEPASSALIADVVEPKKRLEAYGLLRIGGNIGWTLGPLLGGLLSMISYPFLFIISAAATGTVSIIVFMFVAESISSSARRQKLSLRDLGRLRNDHRFLAFCLISIPLFMMFGQMASNYAVFSTEIIGITNAEIGYIYAVNGLMVVFMQFPVSRSINHLRMTKAMAAGSLLYAIGYGIVGLTPYIGMGVPTWLFSPGFLYLAMCMFIVTMGEMIVSPSSMTLVAKMSPESERGRYQGMYGLVSNFGFSAGPFFGGLLFDVFYGDPIFMWAGIGSFGLLAALGFLGLGRRIPEMTDRIDED
ncbi:MAG TPA: MFS transporter [Methanomassiliicoccales archaeon]|nr:MFS transporter [Methanomassiliicoccales archaeon]